MTVADLVFPWFIYIMGVAMPLSFQALLKNELTQTQILGKIVRRAIILFALGMYINNGASIFRHSTCIGITLMSIIHSLLAYSWSVAEIRRCLLDNWNYSSFCSRHRKATTYVFTYDYNSSNGLSEVTAENLEETDNLLNSASPHLPKYALL